MALAVLFSPKIASRNDDALAPVLEQIDLRQKEMGLPATQSAVLEDGKEAVAFSSKVTFPDEAAAINGVIATPPSSESVGGSNLFKKIASSSLRNRSLSADRQARNDTEFDESNSHDSERKRHASPLTIRTLFSKDSQTIQRKTILQRGKWHASFMMTLESGTGPSFEQRIYHLKDAQNPSGCPYKYLGCVGDMQIYNRTSDLFAYIQNAESGGEITLKEWIFARQPNSKEGSEYTWFFESDDPGYGVHLEKNNGGGVSLFRFAVAKTDRQTDRQRSTSV